MSLLKSRALAGLADAHVSLEHVLSVVPVITIAAVEWPIFDQHGIISLLYISKRILTTKVKS